MSLKCSTEHRPIQPWIATSPTPVPQSNGLHYREFAPPAGLEDIVHVVWSLTGASRNNEPIHYHVVPDACSDLVFDRQAGEGYIFGTVPEAKRVQTQGRISLVGVRLQPHLLPAYIRVPALEMQNREISFEEVSLTALNDLFECHAGDDTRRFGAREVVALSEAVSTLLQPERVNIRARWLTKALLAGGGSVDRAAHTTGFSARQLQRIAEQELGLAPKRLGRILRLQQTFPAVLGGHNSFALIAADHGYADQAHMIREFATLTGYSPGFWRSHRMSDLYNRPNGKG
ncbi:MAG: AraC family transcriptional regulator [Pseudohongiella sp.]|nr:AraC family transcriptional regulator [Pseudohongiella sp.]